MTTDEDFERVAFLADVPPGSLKAVEIDGFPLVLGNVGGELFAVSGLCSHEGSRLELGTLTGHTLGCWAHQWTYDIRTGTPIWPPMSRIAPGYRLRSYAVRVHNAEVFVSHQPRRGGLQ